MRHNKLNANQILVNRREVERGRRRNEQLLILSKGSPQNKQIEQYGRWVGYGRVRRRVAASAIRNRSREQP